MKVRLNEDWVHFVVPKAPEKWGALALPAERQLAIESRPIGEVVAIGPDVPEGKVKVGDRIWFDEDRTTRVTALSERVQLGTRWRHVIGVIESDPVPTPEQQKETSKYIADRKAVIKAKRAARQLVTAPPAAAAALAGAAGGVPTQPTPALIVP